MKPLRLRPPETITAAKARRVIPHDCAIPGFGGIAAAVKPSPSRRPLPPVAVGAPGGRKTRGEE